jgi:hypothetical protein
LEHGYPVSGGGCPTASICLSLVGYYHRQLNECRNNHRRRQSGGGSIPSVTNCLSLYPLFLVVLKPNSLKEVNIHLLKIL